MWHCIFCYIIVENLYVLLHRHLASLLYLLKINLPASSLWSFSLSFQFITNLIICKSSKSRRSSYDHRKVCCVTGALCLSNMSELEDVSLHIQLRTSSLHRLLDLSVAGMMQPFRIISVRMYEAKIMSHDLPYSVLTRRAASGKNGETWTGDLCAGETSGDVWEMCPTTERAAEAS